MFWVSGIGEPKTFPRIVTENENENHRDIHEIAVDVLDDERKRAFTQITLARLADGAIHRIGPERLVIGTAIIVTGKAKTRRRPQDQNCLLYTSENGKNRGAFATRPGKHRSC